MKSNRGILIISLMLIFALTLAACAGSGPDSQESAPSSVSENQTDNTESDPDSEPAAGTILVAYFSHTGNTEAIARQIAQLTGGTLAEIRRAEEYEDLQTEAEAEILEGVRPEITVSVDHVEDYNTIFVGYPIWWNEAPAMIATFLSSYDFSGKTIIPFCTSASDSIDNSLHIFSELCPDADIAGGLTANDEADLEPWLQNLGLIPQSSPEYESVEGQQIKMTSGDVEVIITLNDSRAAAELAGMLPLELTLIERNGFAKGMTLPNTLSSDEPTTREYEIGDFGYWAAGPDLAIFYDDIYEQTIVPVIPLGKAESGAEEMQNTSGTVRLELIPNESAS